MEWIKAGYEFKAWCSCFWNSRMYKQCYSQGTTACWHLEEDGFILPPLLCSWHGGPLLPFRLCLLWCFYTLPVISLSHQVGRKLSKGLIYAFFPPWVCFLQRLWATVQVGRRRQEPRAPAEGTGERSRMFPSQCWRAAKFAHWLVYDHVDDLEQDGITQSEFNAKVLLLERILSFGNRIIYSQTCWEAVKQKQLSVQTS